MRSKLSLLTAVIILSTIIPFVPAAIAADYTYAGLISLVTSTKPMEHVAKLSSPEFRGRQIGDIGEKIASDYIAEQFANYGITPLGDDGTYFQNFNTMIWNPKSPIKLGFLNEQGQPIQQLIFKKDYNILVVSGTGKVKSQPVFVGFGITAKNGIAWDDYAGVDVKDKIVVMFRHMPPFMKDLANQKPELQGLLNLQTFTAKADNALAHGAVGIIVMENPTLKDADRMKMDDRPISGYPHKLPGIFVAESTSDLLLKEMFLTAKGLFDSINEKKQPNSFVLKGPMIEVETTVDYNPSYKARNVIGYIPSSDPFGVNETVLVGAHFDHLGIDPIGDLYPGACDNASGVAAMLEVARIYATSDAKLKSNLVFAGFTGEEIGLVGASYMANNPPFSLDGMTVINLDMVCGAPNKLYASIDPGFTDLLDNLKFASFKIGVDLANYNPSRSNNDSAAFLAKGVTSVFIHGGAGMKWHDTTDTIDSVNADGLQLATKLAAMTAALYTDPFYLTLDEGIGPLESGTPDFEISGYTGKNVPVSVGGRSSVSSETGHFIIPVKLELGDNKIIIRAVQRATGAVITKEIIVNYALRSKAEVTPSMLNFGYINAENQKTLKFTVKNIGLGPLSGDVGPCASWIDVNPKTLNPDVTEITASIDLSKLTEKGFHMCMIRVSSNGGTVIFPVTVVTGSTPIVEVVITRGEKRAYIQDDEVTISQGIESVNNITYLPMSILSMAFGAVVERDGLETTISLRGVSHRIWEGTNVVIIGNKPHTFTGDVYKIKDEIMLPIQLINFLGIDNEEEKGKLTFRWDASDIIIGFDKMAYHFNIDLTKPAPEPLVIRLTSNRRAIAKIKTDNTLTMCEPQIIEITPSGTTFQVIPLTARMKPGENLTTRIDVETSEGVKTSLVVPIKVDDSVTRMSIPIGSDIAQINERSVKLDAPAFITNGTTFVPFRFIGEAFGAQVDYISETKTVRATLGRTTVELVIGKKEAKINGIKTTLTNPPVILKSRTFVPLRFISEAFKAGITWDDKTKTANVNLDAMMSLPRLSLEKNIIDLTWHDAIPNGLPPRETIRLLNTGSGTLVIQNKFIFGIGVDAMLNKDRLNIDALFVEGGLEGKSTILIKSNGGDDAIDINYGIYTQDKVIIRTESDKTWYVNGDKQRDIIKELGGLVSSSALKLISAASGDGSFDSFTGDLRLIVSGKTLTLSTKTGDFTLNDAKMPWKFQYQLVGEDVLLPWALFSLAFGWTVYEYGLGKIEMLAPREKPSQLALDWPSIDLIQSDEILTLKMFPFQAPFYPLRNGKHYNSATDEANYRLYFFFDKAQTSAKLIPNIESINRRYKDKGLNCYLVSTTNPTDSTVEQFFAGNRLIQQGLSSLSLVGLTLPIVFDAEGKVCEGFPGESIPRLYVVDKNDKLVFWLPEFNLSQVIYLEQAIISLLDGQGYIPPDVLTVQIKNSGGKAGSGTLTSTSPVISILTGTFDRSPASVSLSFNPNLFEKKDAPYYKTSSITLLGTSNQVETTVRCWRLPAFSVFASFFDGGDFVRINGISAKLPASCTSGEDPIGPVGLIAHAIGAELTFLPSGRIRMIAGKSESTFEIGSQTATSEGVDFDLGSPFSVKDGVLFGPVKLLAQFANATINRFDKTIIITAPTIKGKTTTPILTVNRSNIIQANYIQPTGGYPSAKDFELDSYPRSSGEKTKLSEILSRPDVKVVIIDFWATWCPPCKMSMPHLEKLWRDYKNKGLFVLGVDMDRGLEVDDDYVANTLKSDYLIRNGLKELGLDKISYPMCYDVKPSFPTATNYKVQGIPHVVVITKDMKWAFTKIGYWPQGHRNLEFTIKRLLGIDESAKEQSITISNLGVGELTGNIECSLSYIKPEVLAFSTRDKVTIKLKVSTVFAPPISEQGFITITSNGGNSIIPIQYSPVFDWGATEIVINSKSNKLTINNLDSKISIPTKSSGDRFYVAANVIFQILGGELKVLPDRRRSVGLFEKWDINASAGSKEIIAGGYSFKTILPVIIEGNNTFIDGETLADIIGAEYDITGENDTIKLRYEP